MGQYNKKLRIIANVVLFIMTLLCILPLILLVVSSFTAEEVLVQNGYSFFSSKMGVGCLCIFMENQSYFVASI